jgi:hypothetical protein
LPSTWWRPTDQALVECLRMIPGQRHVCIEEGTQSTWLYEILLPGTRSRWW